MYTYGKYDKNTFTCWLSFMLLFATGSFWKLDNTGSYRCVNILLLS